MSEKWISSNASVSIESTREYLFEAETDAHANRAAKAHNYSLSRPSEDGAKLAEEMLQKVKEGKLGEDYTGWLRNQVRRWAKQVASLASGGEVAREVPPVVWAVETSFGDGPEQVILYATAALARKGTSPEGVSSQEVGEPFQLPVHGAPEPQPERTEVWIIERGPMVDDETWTDANKATDRVRHLEEQGKGVKLYLQKLEGVPDPKPERDCEAGAPGVACLDSDNPPACPGCGTTAGHHGADCEVHGHWWKTKAETAERERAHYHSAAHEWERRALNAERERDEARAKLTALRGDVKYHLTGGECVKTAREAVDDAGSRIETAEARVKQLDDDNHVLRAFRDDAENDARCKKTRIGELKGENKRLLKAVHSALHELGSGDDGEFANDAFDVLTAVVGDTCPAQGEEAENEARVDDGDIWSGSVDSGGGDDADRVLNSEPTPCIDCGLALSGCPVEGPKSGLTGPCGDFETRDAISLPPCRLCGLFPEYSATGHRGFGGPTVFHDCEKKSGAPYAVFAVKTWISQNRGAIREQTTEEILAHEEVYHQPKVRSSCILMPIVEEPKPRNEAVRLSALEGIAGRLGTRVEQIETFLDRDLPGWNAEDAPSPLSGFVRMSEHLGLSRAVKAIHEVLLSFSVVKLVVRKETPEETQDEPKTSPAL